MARIEYVKKAQARYKRVPVIDPETGRQKTYEVTVRGKVQTRRVTEADKSQPLPLRECEHCHLRIPLGTPYKQVSPRYGRTRYRCGSCPTWQPWDLSDSVAVHLDRIATQYSSSFGEVESVDDAEGIAAEAAEEVRELASRRTEAADNMEDGFGHETEMSERLRSHGDELETFADDLEAIDWPEYPEPEEVDCDDCEGTGELEGHGEDDDPEPCDLCGGSGQITPDDPSEDQVDEWRNEVQQAFEDAMQDAPYGDF